MICSDFVARRLNMKRLSLVPNQHSWSTVRQKRSPTPPTQFWFFESLFSSPTLQTQEAMGRRETIISAQQHREPQNVMPWSGNWEIASCSGNLRRSLVEHSWQQWDNVWLLCWGKSTNFIRGYCHLALRKIRNLKVCFRAIFSFLTL